MIGTTSRFRIIKYVFYPLLLVSSTKYIHKTIQYATRIPYDYPIVWKYIMIEIFFTFHCFSSRLQPLSSTYHTICQTLMRMSKRTRLFPLFVHCRILLSYPHWTIYYSHFTSVQSVLSFFRISLQIQLGRHKTNNGKNSRLACVWVAQRRGKNRHSWR